MSRGQDRHRLLPGPGLEALHVVLAPRASAFSTGSGVRPKPVREYSTVGTFHEGIARDPEAADGPAPMNDLLERAVAEGRGDQSVAALHELLRKPAPTA